jgi:hypothetical protein
MLEKQINLTLKQKIKIEKLKSVWFEIWRFFGEKEYY